MAFSEYINFKENHKRNTIRFVFLSTSPSTAKGQTISKASYGLLKFNRIYRNNEGKTKIWRCTSDAAGWLLVVYKSPFDYPYLSMNNIYNLQSTAVGPKLNIRYYTYTLQTRKL